MADFAAQINQHAAELTELDRLIGDADHGSNLDRGMKAVQALDVADFPDAATYLKKAGMTLVSTVGGASGPLYGTFLLRFAGALEPEDSPTAMAKAWRAGLDGVLSRGKAGLGDKTLVDALQPAVEAMEETTDSVAACLEAGVQAATAGREATIAMVARKGRASYLGERSAGHQDPGATSMVMLLESAERTLS
ncbi:MULTISPECIES: dihydroxyacetone kinase subunit DhaL [unclassified Luteococcus]|uniref:dihydroxyacetone kinase subunit DhaL n=1 Tax=unclassified Luteococcus TaxID=2639923 RepID=UPI00313E15B1